MSTTTTDPAKYQQLRQAFFSRLQTELPKLRQFASTLPELPSGAWQHHASRLSERLHLAATAAHSAGLLSLRHSINELEQQLKRWVSETDKPQPDKQKQFLQQLDMLGVEDLPPAMPMAAELEAEKSDTPAAPPQIFLLSNSETLAQQISVIPTISEHRFHWLTSADALQRIHFTYEPQVLVIDSFSNITPFQIKQLVSRQPGVSILVLGKAADFTHYLHAVKLGADGYMPLPLHEAEFENWVLQHLATPPRDTCRILLIDNDKQLPQNYVCVLEQQQLQFEVLSDPYAVFAALESFYPDVIVMDMQMAACSGPELAKVIRLQSRWLDIPIIYLASEADNTEQLQSLMHSGDDVIAKPISNQRLLATIVARAQRTKQLAGMMIRDSLTGVLQHNHFTERLNLELIRAQRNKQPVVVVAIEIDNYADVIAHDDTPTSNEVLCRLAALLQQQLRQTDLIGRGRRLAEFLLVLPDCSIAQALKITEQIRELFAGMAFNSESQKFFCTFSAGLHNTHAELNAELMIEQAHQAIRLARQQGGNRTAVSADPL